MMDCTTVAGMKMARSDENVGGTRIDISREEYGNDFVPGRRWDNGNWIRFGGNRRRLLNGLLTKDDWQWRFGLQARARK
jgi:hypothetical protein